jgi:hypothetical protein
VMERGLSSPLHHQSREAGRQSPLTGDEYLL